MAAAVVHDTAALAALSAQAQETRATHLPRDARLPERRAATKKSAIAIAGRRKLVSGGELERRLLVRAQMP